MENRYRYKYKCQQQRFDPFPQGRALPFIYGVTNARKNGMAARILSISAGETFFEEPSLIKLNGWPLRAISCIYFK